MEEFVRKQRHAKRYERVKIHRTVLQDERPENYLKNETWAKLSQKAEEDAVFKRLKDGQEHIRNSKMAKLSERVKDGQNDLRK
jgi:uncharacterized membrane protein